MIRTGQPVLIGDTGRIGRRFEPVASDAAPAARAAVLEPLRTPNRDVIGALSLSWPTARAFEAPEAEHAAQVASAVTQAFQRFQVAARDHEIATELQERLLDLKVRTTAALVSARLPAGRRAPGRRRRLVQGHLAGRPGTHRRIGG